MSSLARRLQEAMEPAQVFRSPIWGNPRAMSEALRDVRRTFSASDADLPANDVLQRSLQRFVNTGRVANFTELKHVCYGVTVPLGSKQWSLIDQPSLLGNLLDLVEQQSSQAKQYRRCYQGLLNGYFGFEKQTASSESQSNWEHLRRYLSERLDPIAQATARRGLAIDWLDALSAHRNLLTEDPCGRYADQLQRGDPSELRSLCAALGIASTSWVWDEALMAYVQAVCAGNDGNFQQGLPGVLNLVNGRVDMKLAQLLATRAAGMAVARYARCADKSEHNDLRDTSLRCIGNPWISRTAWDAHVRYEPARQMVEGWIKRRLIRDFFELMAHDGGADLRRLNYWLKREPEVSDMWFVLGLDARSNRSAAFEELRGRMSGRRRSLDDPNAQNNAFVMRIGPLLVIEFGMKGNACYVFAASDFKGDLDKPLLGIHVLKQRASATRLSHNGSWEPRFDYELKQLLQSVPQHKAELPAISAPATPSSLANWQYPNAHAASASASASSAPAARTSQPPDLRPLATAPKAEAAPVSTSDRRFMPGHVLPAPTAPDARHDLNQVHLEKIIIDCVRHGVRWVDNRSKRGAFWVLMRDRVQYPDFVALLEHSGFTYAKGKGFWIKAET